MHPNSTDINALVSDVVEQSSELELAVDADRLTHALTDFAPMLVDGAVSIRTTTQVEPVLHVRSVLLGRGYDPIETAKIRGHLPMDATTMLALMDQVRSEADVLGYGLDFGATTGLEKVWVFFPQAPREVSWVAELRGAPAAVGSLVDVLRRHRMERVSLLGFDFQRRSMNLYFMQPHGMYTPLQISAMVEDLGLPCSPMLGEVCAHAVPIYPTLTWDQPRPARLCFGILPPDPSMIPYHIHPMLARFVRTARYSGGQHGLIFNPTFTPQGPYFKIENDYNGGMIELMRQF
ncbi:MAG: hypothetical protein H6741_18980 [Alphaproteobacteria bacterium]|nr:hypothetical protein [Alphaproteobacteria bacterium]MCB9794795.1 hypothetical protein [Alphaproteobacteria bacterium]